MNHYDTLGLRPDATAEQIKAAYRRCASKAHPDREGGSHERMQAVNRAHAVLSDPVKRERYDRTGIDDGSKTIEEMAVELLGAAFEAALENDKEPVRYAHQRLQETRKQLERHMSQAAAQRKALERRKGKTKVKHGANLVQAIIERRLAALQQQSAQIDEAVATNEKAAELLALYEGEPEPPAAPAVYDPFRDVMMLQAMAQWGR